MTGGKKLVTGSIKEAIQHAGTSDTEVKTLAFKLNVADVKADFEIDTDYNQVSCRVSPEELSESRETFGAIRDWMAKHQPNRWQSKWIEFTFALWMVWLLYFWLSVILVISHKEQSSYQIETVEMVKQGVTITNQSKAIELMLALQTGYNPKPSIAIAPKWWLPSLAFGLLACIIFSIKPSSHIGIGKAEAKVRLWRKWIQLLTVVVPGLLFSSFAWPPLSSLIKSFFK